MKKPKKNNYIIPFSPPMIGEDEIREVSRVMRGGWLTMGPQVLEFEKEFAKFNQAKFALAVNSATAGLHLALVGFGIGLGDEVILPSYTFVSCANTIVWTGAKPVFADILKSGFLLDPEDVEKKVTKKTKAILAVHFGGQMVDMVLIMKLAKKYGLKVIEDCAHSPGAAFNCELAGTIGDVGVFSFYATKNMTTGEGGMVITNNKKLAEKIKILRLHGMSVDAFDRYSKKGKWYYKITEAGFKYNMTDVAASIGRVQLKKLVKMNTERAKIARWYQEFLRDEKRITLPVQLPKRENVWHLYPILVESRLRNKMIDYLKDNNVIASVHFVPLHLQPFYQNKFHYKKGEMKVSEEVFSREISLPIYPSLSQNKVRYICNLIKYFLETNK